MPTWTKRHQDRRSLSLVSLWLGQCRVLTISLIRHFFYQKTNKHTNNMKTVIFASFLAGATAFAPTAHQSSSSATALNADLTKELGAQAPLGFFDPLGILGPNPENGDQADFDERRYIELKHGRVAMLAVVGYLVTYAGIRFPGCEDIPSGFAALPEIPGMAWAQMIATWTMMEAANRDSTGKGEFVGDFRNGALDFGWDNLSEESKQRKRAIELNNGRAAQMGILALMTHELMGNVNEILPLAN